MSGRALPAGQQLRSLWRALHAHSAALANRKLENVLRFISVTDRGGSRYKGRRGSKHVVYGWSKLEADPALGVSRGDAVLNQSTPAGNTPAPVLDLDGCFRNGSPAKVLHDKSKTAKGWLRQQQRSENDRHNDENSVNAHLASFPAGSIKPTVTASERNEL